jgi:hypothetical protein
MSNFNRFLWSPLALAFVLSLGSTAYATTYIVGSCGSSAVFTGPDAISNLLDNVVVAGDTIEACSDIIYDGNNVVYTPNITITNVPKQAKPFVSCTNTDGGAPVIAGSDVGFMVLATGVTIKNFVISSCDVGVLAPSEYFDPADLGNTITPSLQSIKNNYNLALANGASLRPVPTLFANVSPQIQTASRSKSKSKKNNNCPDKDVNLCVTGNVIEDNFIGVLTFEVEDMDISNNSFVASAFAAVITIGSFSDKINNNQVLGFQDVTSQSFNASSGIIIVDGNQETVKGNNVQSTGVALDLETLEFGTQRSTVENNLTKYNAAGLGVDVVSFFLNGPELSSQNNLSHNTSENNLPPQVATPYYTSDALDFTLGGGTSGTANSWHKDNCNTTQDITGTSLCHQK